MADRKPNSACEPHAVFSEGYSDLPCSGCEIWTVRAGERLLQKANRIAHRIEQRVRKVMTDEGLKPNLIDAPSGSMTESRLD
jgi:hypothetical protein